ncbi:PIN domain-containing protein [Bifidobacterium sp. ESL0745]|uniref:type II toxin-antitoxin system VapC family toxin n=1 Tax=Bifidobacterium sp. ESL0745 TaxID=2983226 RepID=UPI0023F9E8BD|nr:PIN domain-containing protein [Bifidobacterium sp. ESL0745]MDF7665301.1 PIN domain-containing protein [Bifidobacterium sp. ESL0745]
MAQNLKLVCDTNVLLDYLLETREGHKKAESLFNAFAGMNTTMMCVSLSLKDVDYLAKIAMKRKFRNDESVLVWATITVLVSQFGWNCIQTLLRIMTVIAVDDQVCRNAVALRPIHNDYEDDLIIAASRQANADMVVTGDQDLIKHFPDLCVSVEDALKQVDGDQSGI